jgi:hypothetical protein
MSTEPRMSPLYGDSFAKMSKADQDVIVAVFTPVTPFQTGDTVTVQADGSFLLLAQIGRAHV